MKNERARPGEFGPLSGQLVTDSMVLEERFVDLAIREPGASFGERLKPAQGVFNGLFLGLLCWLLILLPFAYF